MTDTDHLKLMMLATEITPSRSGVRFVFVAGYKKIELFFNTTEYGIKQYGRYNVFGHAARDTAREVLELLERVNK